MVIFQFVFGKRVANGKSHSPTIQPPLSTKSHFPMISPWFSENVRGYVISFIQTAAVSSFPAPWSRPKA